MSTRTQKIGMDDDLIRAGRDAGIESLSDSRLGQFHVCVTNNLKLRHLLHHLRDFRKQVVSIISDTAVIN